MPYQIMLTYGLVLLAALAADYIGARTRLPRVSLLVLVGALVGPHGFALLPDVVNDAAEIMTSFSLTLIAFLLGSELSLEKLKQQGRSVIVVSLTVVIFTWLAVAAGMALIGVPIAMALLYGAIATATDPAATTDVVDETGATGPFRDLVVGVVAIDDAWGLIVFGLAMAGAAAIAGIDGHDAGWELVVHLGGAVAIGLLTGLPMAYLSGRIKEGRPTQIEAIGFVLVCGGLAMWMGASYLLAATIAGACVANLASHHDYAFREIEHFEWPFLALFFVLSGAMLDIDAVGTSIVLVTAYVGLRLVGRIIGGWVGGRMTGLRPVEQHWTGLSLLPQAGVAVGMGLLAAEAFPAQAEEILAVTIGATVLFEVIGPILTRLAFIRAGATPQPPARTTKKG